MSRQCNERPPHQTYPTYPRRKLFYPCQTHKQIHNPNPTTTAAVLEPCLTDILVRPYESSQGTKTLACLDVRCVQANPAQKADRLQGATSEQPGGRQTSRRQGTEQPGGPALNPQRGLPILRIGSRHLDYGDREMNGHCYRH